MYLGADPEFVVVGADGRPMPAHRAGVLDRETMKQQNLPCFRDGYGAEFNPRPSDCIGLLMNHVRELTREASKRLHGGAAGFRAPAAVLVDPEESLSDAPGDVQQVGCHPSFNIYETWGEPLTAPWAPQVSPLRMFAGHVHFDCPQSLHAEAEVRPRLRALDILMGIPLTYIFQDEPEVFMRREFYGRAGEFRLQTYSDRAFGIEYRTPDATLWRHPAVCALLLNLGRRAFLEPFFVIKTAEQEFGLKGADLDKAVQTAINTGRGLDELLLPSYTTNWKKTDGNGGLVSHGRVSREAIQKLRKIRPRFFGPETKILEDDFFLPPNGETQLGPFTVGSARIRPDTAHLTLQRSWPDFPLFFPGWREEFTGLEV
jgi:hypothetical protein